MENINQLNCYVNVTGEASDAEDKDLEGFYLVEVHLCRQVALDQLTSSEKSEIAKAALDSFHEKQGISTLDDFSFEVLLPNGSEVTEGDDVPASGLIVRAVHVGQVDSSDLPFKVQVSPDVETLIAASLQHGLDSEPDHEAGDLQDYFRAGWGILSSSQRTELLLHSRLKTALETATGKELHKIKKLLVDDDDKKIVAIFAIFHEHGNDEGAETEISDLQDALRSCWDVLAPAQRTELLELDSVQETFENATMEPLFPDADVDQTDDSETPGSRS